MKKIILPLFCVVALASCSGSMTAKEYNNAIVKEQSKLVTNFDKVFKVMDTDSALAQKRRIEAVELIDASLANLENISFKGDDNHFKASFKKALEYFKTVFAEDLQQIIVVISNKQASEQDIAVAEQKFNEIMKEAKRLDVQMQVAQAQFTKTNNLNIRK